MSKKKEFNFFEQFYKKKAKLGKEDFSAMLELIKNAEGDLKASKLLFENKIYNQATYHIQQCCEKVVKCYAVLFGSLSKNNLKAVGHISPRAFLLMAQDINITKFNEVFLKKHKIEASEKDLADFKKVLKKFKERKLIKEQLELAKTKSRDIKKTCESFIKIRTKSVEEAKKKTFSELLDLISIPTKVLNFIIINHKKEIDKIKDLPVEQYYPVKRMVHNMMDYYIMFYLSMITFVHASTSRYGDESLLKINDYNLKLGIVKANPLIRNILKDVIKNLKFEIREQIKLFK